MRLRFKQLFSVSRKYNPAVDSVKSCEHRSDASRGSFSECSHFIRNLSLEGTKQERVESSYFCLTSVEKFQAEKTNKMYNFSKCNKSGTISLVHLQAILIIMISAISMREREDELKNSSMFSGLSLTYHQKFTWVVYAYFLELVLVCWMGFSLHNIHYFAYL